jgi:hypothetical protein
VEVAKHVKSALASPDIEPGPRGVKRVTCSQAFAIDARVRADTSQAASQRHAPPGDGCASSANVEVFRHLAERLEDDRVCEGR